MEKSPQSYYKKVMLLFVVIFVFFLGAFVLGPSPCDGLQGKIDDRQDDKTCEEKCRLLGQQTMEDCMDAGGNEEECASEANAAYKKCEEDCPSPDECDDKCRQVTKQTLEDCMNAGGKEEECKLEAEAAFNKCMEACDEKTLQYHNKHS